MITFLSNMSRLATSTAFWVSFAFLVVSYFSLVPYSTTIKQRSWILTTLSSAVMSFFSLPLVVQFAAAKGQLKHVVVPTVLTDSAGRFFQAYLIVDLTMGMLFYRSKVNLLTGWIHHSVYIFIVEYSIQGRWSYIFCLFAVMEVPTFILAMGSIMPRLRSDAVFAVSFFVTRITFHIVLLVSLVLQRHEVTNGSLVPAIITACVFPLHAYWFTGCIKGFLKRATTEEKSAPVTKLPVNNNTSPGTLFLRRSFDSIVIVLRIERPITPSISAPVSMYAPRVSLARRRTALRMAVRARWDQLKLWRASGRLSEMQRRVRAALPGRERVYQYVGLEGRGYGMSPIPSEYGLEHIGEDAASSALS